MGALAEAGGNQSEAARRLRIGRDALRYKSGRVKLAGWRTTISIWGQSALAVTRTLPASRTTEDGFAAALTSRNDPIVSVS